MNLSQPLLIAGQDKNYMSSSDSFILVEESHFEVSDLLIPLIIILIAIKLFTYIYKKRNHSENMSKEKAEEPINNMPLKWYPVGKDNPINAETLDIRDATLNMIAGTDDRSNIESFIETRSSKGNRYRSITLINPQIYKISLSYPHNGNEISGVLYKSQTMESMWDIYAYDGWLFFVKSWNSSLIYKVHFTIKPDALILDKIIAKNIEGIESTPDENESLIVQNIHSMIQTHVMGKVWPYKIPEALRGFPDEYIAKYLFTQFGNKATIATYANVISISIKASV